jgi:hypothetical protein
LDLNVEEAWAMGFTGKNITTAIMDDGVDYTHPDLMNNFVCEKFILKLNLIKYLIVKIIQYLNLEKYNSKLHVVLLKILIKFKVVSNKIKK